MNAHITIFCCIQAKIHTARRGSCADLFAAPAASSNIAAAGFPLQRVWSCLPPVVGARESRSQDKHHSYYVGECKRVIYPSSGYFLLSFLSISRHIACFPLCGLNKTFLLSRLVGDVVRPVAIPQPVIKSGFWCLYRTKHIFFACGVNFPFL